MQKLQTCIRIKIGQTVHASNDLFFQGVMIQCVPMDIQKNRTDRKMHHKYISVNSVLLKFANAEGYSWPCYFVLL